MRLLTLFCLLAVPGLADASGKRGESVLISFHLETSKEEWPKFAHAIKLGNPAQQYYFKLAPEITDRDVVWYFPFPAEGGAGFGVALKLNQRGTQRLEFLSRLPENRGKLLVAHFQPISKKHPPVRSYVKIDRAVSDGVLVIWGGLGKDHLKALRELHTDVREAKMPG